MLSYNLNLVFKSSDEFCTPLAVGSPGMLEVMKRKWLELVAARLVFVV